MLTLPGYHIDTYIYESSRSLVYRGQRIADQVPVVIKLLKQTYPTAAALARYRQEYQLTHSLDLTGVIKAYALEKYHNTLAIVFEDFGAESLRTILQGRSLSMLEKLNLMIQVTQHLEQIHVAQIIHKDINPANVVVNLQTQQSKLIDFGLATILPRETPTLDNVKALEGTLPYLSPEQTGRMNRSLDYRTDFYSFGVMCYELFTGQLPFTSDDPVELVHAHLAKRPVFPHEVNPDVPEALSTIIMKLLAKNAEERYQSAWGIRADFLTCRDQWLAHRAFQVFPLAQQDVSIRFQIPQKLYGREAELTTLLSAFERVASAGQAPDAATQRSPQEMVLVSGHSGIGKSALVQEMYKPVTQYHGFFAVGKFDQFQRNIPYSAIIQAFQGLVQHLLSEDDRQLASWRSQLLMTLGHHAGVVTHALPELKLILGDVAPVTALPSTEAQTRFNLAFQSFISVFAQPNHPLVLFLDDLQWADSASLQLMKLLMTATDPSYFFLIGAYRNNEVSSAHPLRLMIQDVQEHGITVHEIFLQPLNVTHINQLIADTLHCPLENSRSLANLVRHKTAGNPFFVNELLTSFHEERLIYFDQPSHQWQWQLARMQQQGVTENVVDLLTSKMQKRSPSDQRLLQVAASLGNQFDLPTLSAVLQQDPRHTAHVLNGAIADNLVQSLATNHRFVDVEMTEEGDRTVATYQFTHDRVQQAAYFLSSPEQRQKTHWHIGQLLLNRTPAHERDQRIFDIVNQLNQGRKFLSESERQHLIQFNRQAGKKAKDAAAYGSAFSYLMVAIDLLPDDCWNRCYALAIALYSEATEVAFLCKDFEQMEVFADLVQQHGHSLLEQVQVYETKIQACIAQDRPMDAIALACEFLDLLGLPLPKQPGRWEIRWAFWQAKLALVGKSTNDLVNLPTMQDPTILAAMNIISRVISAASLTQPNLFVLLAIRMLTLSMRYGNTAVSAHAYAKFGLILCGVMGDIDLGYQFGELALSIQSRFAVKEIKAKVLLVVNDYVIPWKRHVQETLDPFVDAYQSGLESGDLEYAARSAMVYVYHSYFLGRELNKLEQETKAYSEAIAQLKQRKFLSMNERYRQIFLNLLGQSDDPCRLVGEAYNEDESLPKHRQSNDKNALFNVFLHKAILNYLFQHENDALHYLDQAKVYLGGATGLLLVPIFYFYEALIGLAVLPNSSRPQQQQIWQRVNHSRRNLKRWASHAPENHLHKLHLIDAERYRVQGKLLQASDHYDLAIQSAKDHDYVNEEAIAHELAARFYLEQGKITIAQAYFLNACSAYSVWGAEAKVNDLNQRYPELLAMQQATLSTQTSHISNSTSSSTNGHLERSLDLNAVVKASQAISSEIALDKVLSKLVKILLENAGAQRGCLILETRGKFYVEACNVANESEVVVLQSIPVDTLPQNIAKSGLSPAIVNYVARTHAAVVLNNATTEGNFTTDPYIQFHQPQSVLCAPLMNQGQLSGIIYLENRLVTGAFTADRLELVNLLSTQAAISIENSRFYTQMTQLNQAYERFVPNQFLQFLNKDSILDVQLGDQVQREMSVLFADIRNFTTLSESMTPEENFQFINAFLGRMEPVITENNGFIDKYIGDAIMALFSGDAEDSLNAAIAMLNALTDYNQLRHDQGQRPIRIGIGINTGMLMLGTVGGVNRMDSTVISDTVNLASRIEYLTKDLGTSLLISHHTFAQLHHPERYAIRRLAPVNVRGKSELITIYEVFDADPAKLKDMKLLIQPLFDQAIALMRKHNYSTAAEILDQCLIQAPQDAIAKTYHDYCCSKINA